MTHDKLKTPVDLVGTSIQQTVNIESKRFQMSYQMKAVGVVIAGAVATIGLILFVIAAPGLFLFFIGGEILVLDWTRNHLSRGKPLDEQSWDQDLFAKKDRVSTPQPRYVNENE
jgi:hypothetical protein